MRDLDLGSLGLARGQSRLVAHRPEWPEVAARVIADLHRADTERCFVALDHFGSTAVADLPAKPILDISARFCCPDHLRPLREHLVATEWEYRGGSGVDEREFFVYGVPSRVHLHAFPASSPVPTAYAWFRDLLQADAGLRQEYADLKLRLAGRHESDRRVYQREKSRWIVGHLSGSGLQPPEGGWVLAP